MYLLLYDSNAKLYYSNTFECHVPYSPQLMQWSIVKIGESLSEVNVADLSQYSDQGINHGKSFALDVEGRHLLLRGKGAALVYSVSLALFS